MQNTLIIRTRLRFRHVLPVFGMKGGWGCRRLLIDRLCVDIGLRSGCAGGRAGAGLTEVEGAGWGVGKRQHRVEARRCDFDQFVHEGRFVTISRVRDCTIRTRRGVCSRGAAGR